MTIQPTVTIDASGLNRALNLAQEFTRRTPAEACNAAGLAVAVAAKNNMPFVAIPTIDARLSVITSPVIGKRGKPLKNKKRFSAAAGVGAPFAALIIQARANPNSRYNQLTNSRYARASPFKGVSREQGRAAMAQAIHKLIAQRHSGTKFLLAGWVPAVREMARYAPRKYGGGGGSGANDPAYRGADLGGAQPARTGVAAAACVIENNIGYRGLNAASFNRALLRYGTPGLQNAIDSEGARTMNYFLDRAAREELERPFNAAAK